MAQQYSIGIEEEFQFVDPDTRDLRSSLPDILASGKALLGEQLKMEMFQSMVEVGTVVCRDINEVRAEVIRLRRTVGSLATAAGARLVASGAHPFADWKELEVTDNARYHELAESLREVVLTNAVYGLHVHVGVESRELEVQILNEARYFVPHILALSVNSPFWEGRETGLRSNRCSLWGRMPRSGIPDTFSSWDEYSGFINTLLVTHAIDEPKKIWWDIRLHPYFNTIEFRLCDMPTRLDETIALAALIQAVVAKLAKLRSQNLGFRVYQSSLIAENRWRAMRYGIECNLIDFGKETELPARVLISELLEFVDDVVDDLGSREALGHIYEILKHGTGADRQLAVYRQSGDLRAVVDYLADSTLAGVS